jgi:hypothetical protein
MTDDDSPWKELLQHEFRLALEFFQPEVHADLDWGRDHESLDQELRKLDPGGATGKRIVDRLIQAWSVGGDVRYLHIEVQGKRQPQLPKRVHDYNSRLEQHLGQPVASFVILTDPNPKWCPNVYETEIYGTKHAFEFVSLKLLAYEKRADELRDHANPVALFVLAQLAGIRTRKDVVKRGEAKLDLIRLLQARGMEEDDLRRWYRYLDWLLILPPEYDREVWHRVYDQKEKVMPFVTFAERYGMEKGEKLGLEKGLAKGLIQGMHQAIEVALELRFGDAAAAALMPRVQRVDDLARLQKLLQVAKSAPLAEVEAALAAPAD